MSVLAIARVHNVGETALKRGWEYGYRLIDTETKDIRDLSDEVILLGATRGIKVENMRYEGDTVRISTVAIPRKGDTAVLEYIGLPEIIVNNNKIVEDKKGDKRDKLFVLNKYDEQDKMLRVICDCFGRVKEITLEDLAGYCFSDKGVIMNEKFMDGIETDTYVGVADEHRIDFRWVGNKQANEYMTRCRNLMMPMMLMCDVMGSKNKVSILDADERLQGDVLIPNCVEVIWRNAFENCQHMRNVVFGKGVRAIWNEAFRGIRAERIVLNEGLREIRHGTFVGATLQKPLDIPKSVRLFGGNIFDGMRCPEIILHRPGIANGWYASLEKLGSNIGRITMSYDFAQNIMLAVNDRYEVKRYLTQEEQRKLESDITELLYSWNTTPKNGIHLIEE